METRPRFSKTLPLLLRVDPIPMSGIVFPSSERQRRGSILAWVEAKRRPRLHGRKESQGLKARAMEVAMPQSQSFVLLHVVFSTRNRQPFIEAATQTDLHAYLATTARSAGCECLRAGGVTDHVHLAIVLSRTLTIADLVVNLKTSSTKWMKRYSPDHREFAWQRGYGVFSVGKSDSEALCRYIDDQAKHHEMRTFQDEFRIRLRKYGVTFDESYVWD